MKTLIFGGAGFVGLTVAEQLLAAGEDVVLVDRLPLPAAATAAFARLPGQFQVLTGDVTDGEAVARVLVPGIDTVVLGAAVTADAAREARDPQGILQVNLMALTPILRAVRDAQVRRVINLSSAAVYGRSAMGVARVDEDLPPQPTGLYGITKFTSEMIGERMAQLWSVDFVSLRLSALFGPWERATGLRDTLSAPFQIAEAARLGTPALLSRPGVRDWIYAPDAARAVLAVARAETLRHRVYNVSSRQAWSALAWGEALAARRPGLVCRLTRADEVPSIALHSDADRAPLSSDRLHAELGWQSAYGLADSVAHLDAWRRDHAAFGKEMS